MGVITTGGTCYERYLGVFIPDLINERFWGSRNNLVGDNLSTFVGKKQSNKK